MGHLRHQKYKNKQSDTSKPINISINDMNEFEKKGTNKEKIYKKILGMIGKIG